MSNPGEVRAEFPTNVSLGVYPGITPQSRLGRSDFVPSTTSIVLSPLTTASTPFILPASPQQMSVVSTSANDTAAGTGAQQVQIDYLTSTFQKKSEIVSLNGVTPVNTVNTDIFRIDRLHVNRTGTGLLNVGTINLTSVGGATTFEQIGPGYQVSETLIHWIAKGWQCIVYALDMGVVTTGGVIFALDIGEFDINGNISAVPQFSIEIASSGVSKIFHIPIVLSNPLGSVQQAVFVSVRGRASNQSATANMRFIDLLIS